MFSKTVKYKDFNGNQKTQEFYFHITKMEFVAMGFSNLEARVKRMMATNDQLELLNEFKAIIDMSAGMRSEDGERFIKTPDAKNELLYSAAYDELLFELCTDAKAASDFINKLVPDEMVKEMTTKFEANSKSSPPMIIDGSDDDDTPQWEREGRAPTRKELTEMNRDQLLYATQHKLMQKSAGA